MAHAHDHARDHAHRHDHDRIIGMGIRMVPAAIAMRWPVSARRSRSASSGRYHQGNMRESTVSLLIKAIWGGIEHDFTDGADIDPLVIGGSVQWNDAIYTEMSASVTPDGKGYYQTKVIIMLPLSTKWKIEPRAELNCSLNLRGYAAQAQRTSTSVLDSDRHARPVLPHMSAFFGNAVWGTPRD